MLFSKYVAALSTIVGICSGLSTSLEKRSGKCLPDGLRCPRGVVSCSAPNLNTCCSPDVGLYTYTVGWYPKTGPSDSFTIHGLWPDYCDGTWPPDSGCDPSRNLDAIEANLKALNPTLYNYMLKYWPSSSGDYESFWLHEWNKHGTCVSTVAPGCFRTNPVNGTDAIRYFEQAVEYFKKFDVYNALKKHNIVPTANTTSTGNQVKYKVSEIKAAIKEELGADVAISCKNDIMYEVSFYYFIKDQFEPVWTKAQINDTCTQLVYLNKY